MNAAPAMSPQLRNSSAIVICGLNKSDVCSAVAEREVDRPGGVSSALSPAAAAAELGIAHPLSNSQTTLHPSSLSLP
eukprot:2171771-Pyramimonas_sp.AAC.1